MPFCLTKSSLKEEMLDSACFRPTHRASFEDKDFGEAVSLIKYSLKGYFTNHENEEEKMKILLILLKFLLMKDITLTVSLSEQWMQLRFAHMPRPDEFWKNLSTDVCVVLISDLECEEKFMELVLEEKNLRMIEDVVNSLGRWRSYERSCIFVTKCLQVLLDSKDVSPIEMSKFQTLLLSKFETVVVQLTKEDSYPLIDKLKIIYAKRFFDFHSLAKPFLQSGMTQFLRVALEPVRNEAEMFLNAHPGDEAMNALKREIDKKLHHLSMMQGDKKSPLLRMVCKQEKEIKNVHLDIKRLESLEAGISFIDKLDESVERTSTKEKSDISFETDILWPKIICFLSSRKTEKFSDISAILTQTHELQQRMNCHKFLELLNGWESITLSIIDKYPEIAKLYAPLICSVDFLTNTFHDLAILRDKATMDVNKQKQFNVLLKIAFDISKSGEITTLDSVFHSCLHSFNEGKLDFFNRSKDTYYKELNLVMNRFSQSDTYKFNELAYLCMVSPFDSLHELVNRGCTSAPLSKLILKFLHKMSSLLFLQRPECEEREIILLLNGNLQVVRKEMAHVMVDFVNGLMEVSCCKWPMSALNPLEVLTHCLIPELRVREQKTSRIAPLQLLLPILLSVLNSVQTETNWNLTPDILDMLVASVFSMINILQNYNVEDFEHFSKSMNEREALHLTICSSLTRIKSLCLGMEEKLCRKVEDKLPHINWQLRFYFIDIFKELPKTSFPIPHPFLPFASDSAKFNFYGAEDPNLVLNTPCQLWVLVFKTCEVNKEIGCSLVENILRASSPEILNIVTAVSQSLIESTMSGWESVAFSVRVICQTGSIHLFKELNLSRLDSSPLNVRTFAQEVSVITHAFIIMLNNFTKNEQIVLQGVKKIEKTFQNYICESIEDPSSEGVECLKVLYMHVSLIKKEVHLLSDIFDSLTVQILESVNRKDQSRPGINPNSQWNKRLSDFKKYIVEKTS